jgi:hypothetical protein
VFVEDLAKWGWHDSDYDKGWECDFERMRLGAAFNGLGLNAKSRYDDEGNPTDGDNDCFSIIHYDKEDVKDPNAEWPDMKPIREQKYKVGEKEYTVSKFSSALRLMLQVTDRLTPPGYWSIL